VTDAEQKVIDLLNEYRHGLTSKAIIKLTGLDGSPEWKELLVNLEKRGLIRCGSLPFYGGWFPWYPVVEKG
jgi:DNA-binding IclR family transcriptional regulator